MKSFALNGLALIALCSPPSAFAQDRAALPCTSYTDLGTTVTWEGMGPLGLDTRVIAYPNALGIQLGPDRIAIIGYGGNGKWVAFKGNPVKRDIATSTTATGDDLWDQLELVKRGSTLTVSRKGQPSTQRVRFTVAERKEGESPTSFGSTLELESSGGASLGRLTSRIPNEEQEAGNRVIEALPKAARKAITQDVNRRVLEPSTAHADFAAGQTEKVRTGCGSGVTDLTGGGTPATPSATTARPGS
jgi:hypothetical protein